MTQSKSPAKPAVRYRVDRTAKEDRLSGGWPRHASRLCLSDGRQIGKAEAIMTIREGNATYYLLADGWWAEVEVAERCPRCTEPYLRSSRDSSSHEALIRLPDC